MLITIQLSQDLDNEIARLAAERGLSKQQVLIEAARRYVEQERGISRTLANANRVVTENRSLLHRLGQ